MTLRRSPSQFQVFYGTATLVGGTAANVDARCITHPDNCTILLSRNTPGGTLGFLFAPSSGRLITDTTFDIASLAGADVSTVNWIAIPKNIGIKAVQTGSTNFVADGSLRRPPSGILIAKGKATLVGGTATVTVGKPFTLNAKIFLTANSPTGTQGKLSAPQASVNPVTGQFVINSNSATDTSTVDWILIDQPMRFSPSGYRMAQARGTLTASVGPGGPISSGPIDGMNPFSQPDIVALASIIDPGGTSGDLAILATSRAPTITDGSITVFSSDDLDVSTFEAAAF